MVSAGEFRNGLTVEMDGDVFQILEFQHVKPGKGAAFVRTKLKNITSNSTIEKTFRPQEKLPKAHLDRKAMQFLYKDDDFYNFMDIESYEQISIDVKVVGDDMKFVKENDTVKILSYKDKVLNIEPDISVELTVTDTEPGVKGGTSTNVTKSATLETGAVVQVPLFINVGEVIKIDTRTGEYSGRA